jgi:15-cis-phytoene synthase
MGGSVMIDGSSLLARRILERHSKSFAFAGRLLPPLCRDDAAALYAWCRRCDDAVDGPPQPAERAAAVERLRGELESLYGTGRQTDPLLAGFQGVVRRRAIPRRYLDDLLDGMAMDVGRVRYRTFDDLLLYCYRVAGTVGLMMAHIMGATGRSALQRAADLGIAMQLTNICRDVAEDARRDRVYLPQDLLTAVRPDGGRCDALALAVEELLRRAEAFYRSGDAGLASLPIRCAIGIRAARLIYAEIGREIGRRGHDVWAGRAVVSTGRKAWLALRAVVETLAARVLSPRYFGGSGPQRVPFALPIGRLPSDAPGPRGIAP